VLLTVRRAQGSAHREVGVAVAVEIAGGETRSEQVAGRRRPRQARERLVGDRRRVTLPEAIGRAPEHSVRAGIDDPGNVPPWDADGEAGQAGDRPEHHGAAAQHAAMPPRRGCRAGPFTTSIK
jgi:hypothetical protein